VIKGLRLLKGNIHFRGKKHFSLQQSLSSNVRLWFLLLSSWWISSVRVSWSGRYVVNWFCQHSVEQTRVSAIPLSAPQIYVLSSWLCSPLSVQ